VIRENPNYDARVVQTLVNGTEIEILSEQTDSAGTRWAYIQFLNDRTGWIVQSLLRTPTPTP
jgi:uncharacterized protein YgiM (DUF1202 family)